MTLFRILNVESRAKLCIILLAITINRLNNPNFHFFSSIIEIGQMTSVLSQQQQQHQEQEKTSPM